MKSDNGIIDENYLAGIVGHYPINLYVDFVFTNFFYLYSINTVINPMNIPGAPRNAVSIPVAVSVLIAGATNNKYTTNEFTDCITGDSISKF